MNKLVPYDHSDFVNRRHVQKLIHPTVTVELRKRIKDALEAVRDPETKKDAVQVINQMLGVSLSNKVLKDRPITIIQHADMKVSNFVYNLLDMYDLCDEIDSDIEIEIDKYKDKIKDEVIFEKYFGSSLESFLSRMKKMFILYNNNHHRAKKEAADTLGISVNYLHTLLREYKRKGDLK